MMKVALALVAALAVLAGCSSSTPKPSSHDHSTDKPSPQAGTAKDPVCGMFVGKSPGKVHEDYKGGHYYFCSPDCRAKFKAAPDSYVK